MEAEHMRSDVITTIEVKKLRGNFQKRFFKVKDLILLSKNDRFACKIILIIV